MQLSRLCPIEKVCVFENKLLYEQMSHVSYIFRMDISHHVIDFKCFSVSVFIKLDYHINLFSYR